MNKIYILLVLFGIMLFSCNRNNNEGYLENEETVNVATKSDISNIVETTGVNNIVNNEDTEIISLNNQKLRINSDDYFGDDSDRCPILRVEVSEDESKRNFICLTFDSAYINSYTYQILDILDRYDAKATFFMTGEFIRSNILQVREIINRGHDIGSHSYSHPNFNELSNEKIIKQIEMTHKLVKDNFGIDMYLFRYPFGSYSKRTVKVIKELGYYPIQWTYDSVDWKNEGVNAILDRFAGGANLDPGNIILFHNGANFTPEALPTIMEHIKRKGLKSVRISDMIYEKKFYIDSLGCQHKKTN